MKQIKLRGFFKLLMPVVVFVFTFQGISAQQYCSSYEIYQEMMKNDPVFRKKQELSKQASSTRSPVTGIVTIPVVFHIVYNNEAENVSDAQIYSQLEVLNEDFNSVITAPTQWSDVAANPEMQFCMATRDIYGNATCGITRTYTDSTQFKIQTSVKDESTGGISGWPATDYMNIFVCDIAGGIRGYATFPDAEDSIDGIVIDYLSFGRGPEFTYSDPNFNLGRTGTHEVGHWLRLTHIWGNGGCDIDDGISDTPVSDAYNLGCDLGHNSCGSLDMVQNYMDYSDDVCMNLFTQGQVDLMRKAFDTRGSRVSILSSKGCDAPAQNEIYFTLNFKEFPEDISWEIRDDLNNIIASDGNFPPGNYDIGESSPITGTSKTYVLDVPDGDYTLKLYDSWGSPQDYPNASYEIKSIYNEVIVSGPGIFTAELSIPFTLDKTQYCFKGTVSNDWYNPANWNRFSTPSDCYDDDIIIESMKECMVDELTLSQQKNLILRTGAKLTVGQ